VCRLSIRNTIRHGPHRGVPLAEDAQVGLSDDAHIGLQDVEAAPNRL
jgi:hypothetical protein